MKKTLLIGGGIIVGLVVILIVGFFALPTVLSAVKGADVQLKDDSNLVPKKVDISKPGNAFHTLSKINYENQVFPELNQWFSDTNPKPIDWNKAQEILIANQSQLELFNEAANQRYYQIPALADPSSFKYSDDEIVLIAFTGYRDISKIASLNALDLARRGKIEASVDQMLAVYNVGHMMLESNITLIGSLTGLALSRQSLKIYNIINEEYTLPAGQKSYIKQFLAQRQNNSGGFESAMKYEYLTTKQVLSEWESGKYDSMIEEGDISEFGEVAQAYSKLGKSSYHFKINMTINEAAELTQKRLEFVKNPCQVKPIPESERLYGIKLYFTENAVGKLINNASSFAFSSIYEKQCALEKNLESLIK